MLVYVYIFIEFFEEQKEKWKEKGKRERQSPINMQELASSLAPPQRTEAGEEIKKTKM